MPTTDRSSDPLAGEVGCLDEPVRHVLGHEVEAEAGEKPWIEITLIAIVLITGSLFGILALAKL